MSRAKQRLAFSLLDSHTGGGVGGSVWLTGGEKSGVETGAIVNKSRVGDAVGESVPMQYPAILYVFRKILK